MKKLLIGCAGVLLGGLLVANSATEMPNVAVKAGSGSVVNTVQVAVEPGIGPLAPVKIG